MMSNPRSILLRYGIKLNATKYYGSMISLGLNFKKVSCSDRREGEFSIMRRNPHIFIIASVNTVFLIFIILILLRINSSTHYP